MSRADHDTAGRGGIALELSASEWLSVVGAAIFEGVNLTVQAGYRDVVAIDFYF